MTIWIPDLAARSGPRYSALADSIEAAIQYGDLQPGDKLPTHRALADQLGVTTGTVTRGYSEAGRRNLVSARVGSGTFVKSADSGISMHRFRIPEQEDSNTVDLGLSLSLLGPQQEMMSSALQQISEDPLLLQELLAYQNEQGLLHHRQTIADWLTQAGITSDPDNLLLCSGGQHAISIALQTVTRPGDLVLSEGLSYPGFTAAARQLHLRHSGLPMDDEGIDPQALESICRQQNPRVLFCMPALHNPTTITTSLRRREQLIDICRRHDLIIIEDNVQFSDYHSPIPPLVNLAPERVFYVGGCAKIMAGGLRIGVLQVPEQWVATASHSLRANCWMTPPLMAEIVCRWITNGAAAQLRNWQEQEAKARHNMVDELLGDFDVHHPSQGFNVWLNLPAEWRAQSFAQQAENNGVLLKTADTFAVGNFSAPQAVRFCISPAADQKHLRKGLEAIQKTLLEQPPLNTPTM